MIWIKLDKCENNMCSKEGKTPANNSEGDKSDDKPNKEEPEKTLKIENNIDTRIRLIIGDLST